MNEKYIKTLEFYKRSLERKQNLVKALHDKRNKSEELNNAEYTRMLILEAEIQQCTEFIEDLKYIVE